MLRIAGLLTLTLSLAVACGPSAQAEAEAQAALEAKTLAELRAHMAELMTRPEHDAVEVEVQHLLVSFAGTPRTKATRTQAEAEALAADLYARALAGEDFDDLVRGNTDDAHPGIYTMTTAAPDLEKGIYARSMMAGAFGNVGWRLEAGDYGVSDYHPDTGPFGYHIIKRLR